MLFNARDKPNQLWYFGKIANYSKFLMKLSFGHRSHFLTNSCFFFFHIYYRTYYLIWLEVKLCILLSSPYLAIASNLINKKDSHVGVSGVGNLVFIFVLFVYSFFKIDCNATLLQMMAFSMGFDLSSAFV